VRVSVYEAVDRQETTGALLWMHAGGFVLGSADADDAYCRRLALEAECVVVNVDYRLAPETTHPGPLDDCHAALNWLRGQAARLRVDPSRLAVGGQSAGAGLAAALALRVRDRSEPPLAFQLLFYPMLDDRTAAGRHSNRHTGEFVWTQDNNLFGWTALLGNPPGGDNVPADAAPARATELHGLAPVHLAVGALDLFLEENLEYGTRLLSAGVTTAIHVYPGAYHGFDRVVVDASVSVRARQDAVAALRCAIRKPMRS